jgi:hypothetical protein
MLLQTRTEDHIGWWIYFYYVYSSMLCCSALQLKFFFCFVRLYCSIIGSSKDDILILEEPGENIYLNIRHTKDFRFITLNVFSDTHSKVLLFVLRICTVPSCSFFFSLLTHGYSFSGIFNKGF